MKKVLALTAGVLVALAPTGTAFAGETAPVPGKAYGNCKHSSSGGNPHTALMPEVGSGKGNGGLVRLGKGGGCAATTEPVTPDPVTTEPATDPGTEKTEPVVPGPVELDPAVPPSYDPGER